LDSAALPPLSFPLGSVRMISDRSVPCLGKAVPSTSLQPRTKRDWSKEQSNARKQAGPGAYDA
jgi:hypothetical protein